MGRRAFICGNDAVAEGVRLSRPHVISAYPITPQTIAVERLADFVEDGSLKAEYMHVESEHSAMACAMGVSSVGARAFTATSSQGLLYMAECLPYASGARMPIVMMNANRSIATPWNIYGDQMDSMFLLNSGWIQMYVEDAQEALDMMIQAYRIAETEEVMTPMMVNLDGFVLTHTYEVVDIPDQKDVDEFLPPINMPESKMDLNDPKSLCITAGNDWNMEFKIKQELDMQNSVHTIEAVDKAFGEKFGRYYGGLLEEYRCEDAEVILITTGSVTGTSRIVVDDLRNQGKKVGLLKLRYLRPFPAEKIREAVKNAKVIGVVDKNISFGYEGTIFTNVNSALVTMDKHPKSLNFIAGIGGRDIGKNHIEDMFQSMMNVSEGKEEERIQYMNVRCEK
ncbi:transketolase C-terminal domain-containing protein [Oceanirhabdus sp. W0125-5]|uniref:transketolase C-terminal domain-containing protein n=1 Tax=Oceanirhabdus sp. W0125-5 TaxID=2999116 RepID=UPI0022F2D62D|nr:transketolase C-terminal domain-containing protein [Oceanirhabdus sp. W0125-5]WBW94670.1 transketolase C-terminal domain-containing protein [Oceanirhabdus sp. W0125-5]